LDLLPQGRFELPAAARLDVWAALLGIPEQRICDAVIASVEPFAVTACDRQIAVDIPRCHQYHPLLRTTDGHNRIHAAIKLWLALNPSLRYWQGVHDVCAPLLALGWDNMSFTAVCLTRLVEQYVPHFFTENAMRHRIATFDALLQYHDPQLANHLLRTHECQSDMYAVSWFLTMFAHVLPTEKVFVLWDATFLSSDVELFTLCVAVALVRQHRYHLLNSDFSHGVQILFAAGSGIDTAVIARAAQVIFDASLPLPTPLRSLQAPPNSVWALHPRDLLRAYHSRPSHGPFAGGVVMFIPVAPAGLSSPLSDGSTGTTRWHILGAQSIPFRKAGDSTNADSEMGHGSDDRSTAAGSALAMTPRDVSGVRRSATPSVSLSALTPNKQRAGERSGPAFPSDISQSSSSAADAAGKRAQQGKKGGKGSAAAAGRGLCIAGSGVCGHTSA
jgi:hypothetical protein